MTVTHGETLPATTVVGTEERLLDFVPEVNFPLPSLYLQGHLG